MNKKIVCLTQVYNELSNGNLERFFRYNERLFDEIVIYDDASTDGSYEFSLSKTEHVIRGYVNNFKNEIFHKQTLLNYVSNLSPDFIIWLDSDELLSFNSADLLPAFLENFQLDNFTQAARFNVINLWRSVTFSRVDSLYSDNFPARLFKFNSGLKFKEIKSGLHQGLPLVEEKYVKTCLSISIMHFGFCSSANIVSKYIQYQKYGQSGYDLSRLIDESALELTPVEHSLLPPEFRIKEIKPTKISVDTYLFLVSKMEQCYRPKFSIVCLIYKSTDWLYFVRQQILKFTNLEDKEFFFVANDASETVINFLSRNYIPHYIHSNNELQKNEWYINNVYRAWNFAASKAKGDFIVFINSDMCFCPNWFENLFNKYDGKNTISSRLVESGKLRTGKYGVIKNFGKNINEYREDDFLNFSSKISQDKYGRGGLFMPLLIRKSHFFSVKGYPEGNIVGGSDFFSPEIAKQNDENIISGDVVLMEKLKTKNVEHITSFDSIAYHFQTGEMDEVLAPEKHLTPFVKIAICNDLCSGVMGEKVLWNYLLEGLPGAIRIDKTVIKNNNFEHYARECIENNKCDYILQNASFINLIDPSKYTVVFIQDNLRRMGRRSLQQEFNLKNADLIVTNSFQLMVDYHEYKMKYIPVGIDTNLFNLKDKLSLRKNYKFPNSKIGIFVGDLTITKGWPEVEELINSNKDIHFIVVSKGGKSPKETKNISFFSKVDQRKLSDLLGLSDFFIIGSKTETQCLAAIEANLCNIPVLMHDVGIYQSFSELEKKNLGVFVEKLSDGVDLILEFNGEPRSQILLLVPTWELCIKKWILLFQDIHTKISQNRVNNIKALSRRSRNRRFTLTLEFIIREYFFNALLGKRYLNFYGTLDYIYSRYFIINLTRKLHIYTPLKLIYKKMQSLLRG